MTKPIPFSSFFLLGIIFSFLFSCRTQKEVVTNPIPETNQVDFTTVGKGVLHGAGEEGIENGNIVIRTESDWEYVKGKMNSVNDVTTKFADSVINFEIDMVIACFDKVRSSGGYDLKIKDVKESETRIEVTILLTQPTGESTSVMTQPFHLVKVPLSTKEVVFK